ncbi:hypothetical protein [Bradyrhizobium sp. AZCC 2230]|uniref:hypothetical protein n=1 Tax=Bradyrhizobium sp. AZCC 2230 TaxID=3117021 RepID=UPI002FF23819
MVVKTSRLLLLFSILFLVPYVVRADSTWPLKVDWEGQTILFAHNQISLEFGPEDVPIWRDQSAKGLQKIDCYFADMKAACFKLTGRPKRDYDYGDGLAFVRPIAVLSYFYGPGEPNWDKVRNTKYLASRKPFAPRILSSKERTELPEHTVVLGHESQSHVFAPADQAIGGMDALEFWKEQVGKRPNRQCLEVQDFCSVVVHGDRKGSEAYAYCSIMNSPIGLGFPFNCNVVAYEEKGGWYVLSYDTPQIREGGAAFGADCEFETKMSLDDVLANFQSIMKNGITNIDLKEFSRKKQEVSVAGKNLATPSKFFAGYYDNAYAVYTVKVAEADPYHKRSVSIGGLFNLLISVEPSDRSKDYRDIGDGNSDSDLEWFQNQVLAIIKHDLGQKLRLKMTCEVQPIQ